MLRHEDNSEESASPAAQVRVTPQELAEALARMEARQGQREGTIPLGDAVQELGLNTTSEELLREIEAGRAQEVNPKVRRTRGLRFGVSGLACGIFLIGSFIAFRLERLATSVSPMAAVISLVPPQAAPIAIPDNLLVRRPDHTMVLLSEVGDNQPALCELATTETGAKFADFAPASLHWTLIKHGGRVYVRGWIGDMSAKALRSTVVSIHPAASYVTSGMRPVCVTLAIDGFQSPPGLTSDDMISATRIVPDQHFQEKW